MKIFELHVFVFDFVCLFVCFVVVVVVVVFFLNLRIHLYKP